MNKRGIPRLTDFINYRDVVVGLGILISLLLLYWMREDFSTVVIKPNFFGVILLEALNKFLA